jgi:peptidoglycan/xylan/chitin deacetylase (PgdA/CDA1 family)
LIKPTPFSAVTLLIAAGTAVLLFLTGRPVVSLAAGLTLWVLLTGAGVCFQRLRFFGSVTCRRFRGSDDITLTFDDGPDPETTPMVLDWLDKHGLKAVFFLVGQKALSRPELVREIRARGHETGSHTDHHRWYTNFLTGHRLRDELTAGVAHLEAAGSGPVKWFRYPMGLSNPVIAREVRRLGLTAVGWNRRCYDTRAADAGKLACRLSGLRPGDIVLLHDAGHNVPVLLEALDMILEYNEERSKLS